MAMNYLDRGDTVKKKYFSDEDNDRCVELLRVWRPKRMVEIEAHKLIDPQTIPQHSDVPIPEFVASSILKICTKVSVRHNYLNYPFREDMVAEAVYNMIRYLHSFDVERIGERSKKINFFSWVTKCADRSFGSYIGAEERHDYCKNAAFIYSTDCNSLLEELEQGNSDLNGFNPKIQNDFIDRAINYERKQQEVRNKSKAKHQEKHPKKPKQTNTTQLF